MDWKDEVFWGYCPYCKSDKIYYQTQSASGRWIFKCEECNKIFLEEDILEDIDEKEND